MFEILSQALSKAVSWPLGSVARLIERTVMTKRSTPPLIRHIERHMGLINPKVGHWGWDHADGTLLQVVAFRDQPTKGATTLCSLGLGYHESCSPGGHVRQEVLVSCLDRFVSDRLAELLPIAVEPALERHEALRPWQVLRSPGPLLPGIALDALLCLEPLLFPDSFATFQDTTPATEFVWLVPISSQEVAEVNAGRGEQLLAKWERHEVDILDWGRA